MLDLGVDFFALLTHVRATRRPAGGFLSQREAFPLAAEQERARRIGADGDEIETFLATLTEAQRARREPGRCAGFLPRRGRGQASAASHIAIAIANTIMSATSAIKISGSQSDIRHMPDMAGLLQHLAKSQQKEEFSRLFAFELTCAAFARGSNLSPTSESNSALTTPRAFSRPAQECPLSAEQRKTFAHIEIFLIMNPLRHVANLTICCRPRRLRVVLGLKST